MKIIIYLIGIFFVISSFYIYFEWEIYRGSKAYNEVIANKIDSGESQFHLKDILPKNWDCVCLLEQYHTAKESLYTCMGKNANDYKIIPNNYSASEGENGLIFINDKNEARIFVPNWDLEGEVWPCYEPDNSYVEVQKQRNNITLYLKRGEK